MNGVRQGDQLRRLGGSPQLCKMLNDAHDVLAEIRARLAKIEANDEAWRAGIASHNAQLAAIAKART